MTAVGALRPAQRDPELVRLQRGGIAAPAAVDFLERERLLDSEPMRDGQVLPGCRRRPGLPGLWIPARPAAGRGDRAARLEGRQNLHFDLGRNHGLLIRYFGIDLDDAADPEEIAAGVDRVDLCDAEVDRVG